VDGYKGSRIGKLRMWGLSLAKVSRWKSELLLFWRVTRPSMMGAAEKIEREEVTVTKG